MEGLFTKTQTIVFKPIFYWVGTLAYTYDTLGHNSENPFHECDYLFVALAERYSICLYGANRFGPLFFMAQ